MAVKPPAVLLERPKYNYNLGNTIRALACTGVFELYWTGDRIEFESRLPREERLSGYRDVKWQNILLDSFNSIAQGRVPIAVEARDNFQSLVHFQHPPNALYMFGPEDGSLSGRLVSRAHAQVVIPTRFCVSLPAAVYILLYDREVKRIQAGGQPLEFQGRASGCIPWERE